KFSHKDENSLLDIFIAADEIQLAEIKQKAEKRLLETESAWKFPKDFITICKYDIFADLYQIALELVCRNPKIIFESEDFLKMEEKVLIRLLKCDGLRLEEIEIWNYLIKWGIENTESILDDDTTKWTQTDFIELEKVLHNCIPHIRFFQLSFFELRFIITKYKNILPDNLDEILQYFLDPKYKNNLQKRESAYSFNSKLIDAKDAALIASWIDKKQGFPYRFKDMPVKFELIYQASRENFSINKFHECPCFGFKDLWVEYNKTQRSTIGISKQHTYELGIIDKDTFEIEDYEVFQITYKNCSFGTIFDRVYHINACDSI
ncbi:23610_t:CDS:2, partial [Racocetra persica]